PDRDGRSGANHHLFHRSKGFVQNLKGGHGMATIEIFKDTNFGAAELVWNVPHPDYDFNQHEKLTFTNVTIRQPLLTTRIVVHGQYTFDTAFYDYMRLTTDTGRKVYYFISSIIAERNVLIFN